MNTAITALFEMLKQLFCLKQTSIEHQTTSDIVKDKKKLKQATDITEKILTLTDKYRDKFTDKDLKRYNKLKEKFLKVN